MDEGDEKDKKDKKDDEEEQYFLNVKKIQRSQNVDQDESTKSAELAETFGEDVPEDFLPKDVPDDVLPEDVPEDVPDDVLSEDVPDDVLSEDVLPEDGSVLSKRKISKISKPDDIEHPLKENEIKFGNELSEGLRKAAVDFLKGSIERYSKDRKTLASMILGEHDLNEMIQSQQSQDTNPNVQDNIVPTTPYSNTHFHSLLKTMFMSFYNYEGPIKREFEHNKFYFEIKITITEKRIKLIIDIEYDKNKIFHVSLFINKINKVGDDAYQISSIHITKDNNILTEDPLTKDPNEKKYVFIKLTNLFTIFSEYSKSDISTFIAHILQLLSEIFIIKKNPKEEITKISSTKINNFVYDVCRISVRKYVNVSGGRIQKNKTTSKPKATTAKPKATTSKPKATTAKPKTTTAKPKTTTAKPKATTAKPKATTAKPKATTAKPKATTAKPKATTAKPKTTTAKPKTTTAKPKATTAKPKATTAKPKATTAKPKATTAKPKATTAKPKATTAKPKATTAKPKATTAKPKATTAKPREITKSSPRKKTS
jgi:hypothetical protein